MLIEDVDFFDPELKAKLKAAPLPKRRVPKPSFLEGPEHLSRKDLRLFAASLASLIEGGIPLLRCLQVLRKESGQRAKTGAVLMRVENRVRQGESFSEALQSEPDSFPSFFSEMVRAGESSGNLDTILRMLADHLDREEERQRKLIEAASYPAVVMVLGFVTFCVLLKFVIPKIASVYEDFGSSLPAITRLVLAASRLMVPGSILLACLLMPGFFYARKKQDEIALFFLRMPLVGPLMKKNLLSVFSSLMALELKSGLTVLQTIESIQRTVKWSFFQNDLNRLKDGLTQGEGFSESLRPFEWMPESASVLIQAGQESGRLPEAFEHVHREASREFESQVHFLLKILEPLLILGVGCVVGVIVISAILPILEINTLVR